MPFVFYNGDGRVTLIHYEYESLSEERKSQGIYVDNIPVSETKQYHSTRLYINPETKEMWYEYVVSELGIEIDKQEVIANGEDYATITIHVPDYLDADTVYFIINGEPQVEESPIVDGKAEFEIAVEDEGLYLIEALVGGESRKLVLKGVSA